MGHGFYPVPIYICVFLCIYMQEPPHKKGDRTTARCTFLIGEHVGDGDAGITFKQLEECRKCLVVLKMS